MLAAVDKKWPWRNCDSTFGLGSHGNEDYLCWVSSSQATEGSQDVLKADAKLNSLPENCATYTPGAVRVHNGYKIPNLDLDIDGYNSLLSWFQMKEFAFADVKHFYSDASCLLFSSLDLQQQKHNIRPDSVQTIDRGYSFEVPDIVTNEKREKLNYQHETQAPLNSLVDQARVESQVAFYDPVTSQKHIFQSERDEGHGEGEGFSVGKQAELASTSHGKVGYQDKRIRDSLYRLARSAEQRHNCANTSESRDDKDASGPLEAKETSKHVFVALCTRFMDIETNTNPIDISIAHLLFHRPSDPSLRPVTETSLKSYGTNHRGKGSLVGGLGRTRIWPPIGWRRR
ncbi:hypothetical protein F3Y22_tig00003507pilonHSYRG00120 [Hibiscus syriacus]|uniref:Uncharacterized protein n=1 Tax=Hibiscus syriacus TaxID=106335 RepID=A0A6A3CL88_HIBSY|nr:hypothetical protein F3Y22_tig00003507pilonHSYRG00120 [Hibiscus syriacus]